MSTYTEIFKKNQYNLPNAAVKSRTWFQQQAKLLTRQDIKAMSLIRSEPERNVNRIVPGEMYLFAYNPKHKDILPHWDMFPMVFPFHKLKDGFVGLNLHYLPYQLRIDLLNRLMDFKTNNMLNENTRLKYSWATVSAASRYSHAIPCVHRYLSSHIMTPLKKIDAVDWATALMLPVEKFVGATKQQVWSGTIR